MSDPVVAERAKPEAGSAHGAAWLRYQAALSAATNAAGEVMAEAGYDSPIDMLDVAAACVLLHRREMTAASIREHVERVHARIVGGDVRPPIDDDEWFSDEIPMPLHSASELGDCASCDTRALTVRTRSIVRPGAEPAESRLCAPCLDGHVGALLREHGLEVLSYEALSKDGTTTTWLDYVHDAEAIEDFVRYTKPAPKPPAPPPTDDELRRARNKRKADARKKR